MPSDRDWTAEIAAVRGDGFSAGYGHRAMFDATDARYPGGTTSMASRAIDARDAIIDALAARLQEVEGGWRYPHMCRDEHQEIGHADSESEMCPVCTAIAERDAAREEADAYAKLNAEVGGELAHALEREARLRGLLGEWYNSWRWPEAGIGQRYIDATRAALDGDKGER